MGNNGLKFAQSMSGGVRRLVGRLAGRPAQTPPRAATRPSPERASVQGPPQSQRTSHSQGERPRAGLPTSLPSLNFSGETGNRLGMLSTRSRASVQGVLVPAPPVVRNAQGHTPAEQVRVDALAARRPHRAGALRGEPATPVHEPLVSAEEVRQHASGDLPPLSAARHAELFRMPASIEDAHRLVDALGNASEAEEISTGQYLIGSNALLAYVRQLQQANLQDTGIQRSAHAFIVGRAVGAVEEGRSVDEVMQQFGFHPDDLGMRRRLEEAQQDPEESPFFYSPRF